MSESSETEVRSTQPPSPPFDGRDWFLVEYIRLAELGIEQGITLNVGGLLITGRVISAAKYFTQMAADIREATVESEAATDVPELIAGNYEEFSKQMSSSNVEIQEGRVIPHYIHLADSKVVLGKLNIPSNRSVLWRGKVASVDAFFPGQITTS